MIGGSAGHRAGGFLSLEQVHSELRQLAARYPSWVSMPQHVGVSHEGRPIELVCLTKDLISCTSRSERPTVLYTALMHAREPATLVSLLHFLRTTLRRAEAGDQLLARRKLLFIAVLNPDGYAWNMRTKPRGGGMKRKNGRRTCSRSASFFSSRAAPRNQRLSHHRNQP